MTQKEKKKPWYKKDLSWIKEIALTIKAIADLIKTFL